MEEDDDDDGKNALCTFPAHRRQGGDWSLASPRNYWGLDYLTGS